MNTKFGIKPATHQKAQHLTPVQFKGASPAVTIPVKQPSAATSHTIPNYKVCFIEFFGKMKNVILIIPLRIFMSVLTFYAFTNY